MNKRFKQLSQIILGFVTIIIITLLILFFWTFLGNEASNFLGPFLLYISAFFSFILVLFFKKKKVYFYSSIIFIVFIIGLNGFHNYRNNIYTEHSVFWNNSEHSTTIPFYTLPSMEGLIYIKVNIDDKLKYLLFDTGAGITGIDKKLNIVENDILINLRDSNKKTGKLKKGILNQLFIGDLNFKNLDCILLEQSIWDNENGIFFDTDSIGGVLGNNIINSFVWDFNMKKRTIKISDKKFSDTSLKAHNISLVKSGKRWKVNIKINQTQKNVTLDSGSYTSLTITDSIKNLMDLDITRTPSLGLFSSLDTIKKSNKDLNQRLIFANIGVSKALFKEALIVSPGKSNLLGIPLFWEYDRVILDFIGQKIYLFNESSPKSDFSITNKSKLIKDVINKKPVPNKV